MSVDPKIYVACLSAYNDGRLHGKWIELEGLDADDIYKEINAILKTSPCPNIMKQDYKCQVCGHSWSQQVYDSDRKITCSECDDEENIMRSKPYSSSKEWAIHDFEGLPKSLGENPDITTLVEIVALIEEHGEVVELLFDHGYDLKDVGAAIYNGFSCARSLKEYAEESFHEIFNVPDEIAPYIDYDAYARDLEIEMLVLEGSKGVYIFNYI